MDAFEVLDELCWRKLFKLLKPEELCTFSLVCERFDWILQDSKTEWMLELVLPSILPYLERNELHQTEDPNRVAMHFFPDKRMWKELYKLRSVCKAWRCTIDAFMSRDSFRSPGPVALVDGFGMNELFLQEGPGWSRFTDNVQLTEFISTFKETKKNPFPGRKAIIYDLMDDEAAVMQPVQNLELPNGGIELHFAIPIGENGNILQADGADAAWERKDQFYEKRGEFFQLFGKYLWHANIGFNRYGEGDGYYMEDVIAYLPHLPNIKELIVGCTSRATIDGGMWGRIDLAKLPELRDLNTIVFEMVPRPLGVALLAKYGPQLTELELNSKCNNLFFFSSQMDLMTSLRSLSITLSNAHFGHLFTSLGYLRSLESLHLVLFKTSDWQRHFMEQLTEEIGDDPIFKMDKLVRSIRHLPLANLTIEVHRGDLTDSGKPIYVQDLNYHIRTFNLIVKFSSHPSPPIHILFNFLPSMKTLTSFNLIYEYQAEENLNELPQRPTDKVAGVRVTEFISESEAKLYQSNIWGEVPSLQNLSMEYKRPQNSTKKTFTRQEYQVEVATNGIANL